MNEKMKNRVRKFMKRNIETHRDSLTGEVSETGLAEEAAIAIKGLEANNWLDNETHEVWYIAFVVAK